MIGQIFNFSTPALEKRADHPLGKRPTFLDLDFLANRIDNHHHISHGSRGTFCLSTDIKKVGFT
jgi:hypothetical protein